MSAGACGAAWWLGGLGGPGAGALVAVEGARCGPVDGGDVVAGTTGGAEKRGTGAGTTTAFAADPETIGSERDGQTGHTLPRAFADFRARVGIETVGLAVTEPFWANVKVAGRSQPILIQAFERRVLTYNPTNPPAFQVEFGNVGQQYYAWRAIADV